VGYYERLSTNPSLDFIQRAASVLAVTVAELVADDEEAAAPTRGKRGPKSRLEERIERVRKLPRREQELAIRMLDALLDGAQRSSASPAQAEKPKPKKPVKTARKRAASAGARS